MSIVVRFKPTNLTTERYDASVSKLEASGLWPPDGLEFHVMFGTEGALNVSDVWDSREELQTFGETLMPILAEIGIEFSGEPEIFEVHASYKR